MKPFKTIICNDKITKNNWKLTRRAMQKAAKEFIEKVPVLERFDSKQVIGYVEDVMYINGNLISEIKLFTDNRKILKSMVFRLCFLDNLHVLQGKVKIIKEVEIISVGMINKLGEVLQ